MEFYAQNNKKRPIRLSEKTRIFAYESLNRRYGLETLETNSVCVDDVLDFVSELLHKRAREIEKNEPYAMRTVDELDKAAYEVWDLINYVSELEEE